MSDDGLSLRDELQATFGRYLYEANDERTRETLAAEVEGLFSRYGLDPSGVTVSGIHDELKVGLPVRTKAAYEALTGKPIEQAIVEAAARGDSEKVRTYEDMLKGGPEYVTVEMTVGAA